MKKILITGADSYIGMNVEAHLKNHGDYEIDTVDMKDGTWREKSFSGYDSVFHVAGIAHLNHKKMSLEEKEALYYGVNTDLAFEVAQKSKADGVKQFIFMSSASVYGDGASVGKPRMITRETKEVPSNIYGESKLRAERKILPLNSDSFTVAVLRPPMIYGKNCPGNYASLSKMAKKLPVFPKVKNERSMIYIGNFAEFVRLIIDNQDGGIFMPQNSEYSITSELISMIAEAHGKRIRLLKGFAWLLKLVAPFTGLVNKAFGNFTYDFLLSNYKNNYQVYELKESIEITEK